MDSLDPGGAGGPVALRGLLPVDLVVLVCQKDLGGLFALGGLAWKVGLIPGSSSRVQMN